MSFIEVIVAGSDHQGWLCNDDLLLHCHRENFHPTDDLFIDRIPQFRRFVPQLDFSNEKVFRSFPMKSSTTHRNHFDDEDLLSELNSLLDCREYVRQTNQYSERKEQIPSKKKFEQYSSRQRRIDDERSKKRKASKFHD